MHLGRHSTTRFDVRRDAATHLSGAGLGEAELKVIALARSDARRTGWEGPQVGVLTRLWQALIGCDPVRPLADDRLETLRLFVCMLLRCDRRVEDAAKTLIAKGFAPYALKMVRALAVA